MYSVRPPSLPGADSSQFAQAPEGASGSSGGPLALLSQPERLAPVGVEEIQHHRGVLDQGLPGGFHSLNLQ